MCNRTGSFLVPWINAPLDAAVDRRLGQFISLVHNRSAATKVKAYFTISTGALAPLTLNSIPRHTLHWSTV